MMTERCSNDTDRLLNSTCLANGDGEFRDMIAAFMDFTTRTTGEKSRMAIVEAVDATDMPEITPTFTGVLA